MSLLLELCQGLPVWSYEPGDTVLQEDRKDGRLYVLKRGTVEVRKRDQSLLTTTMPGAIFGEVALLLRGAHSASVVAVDECEFYVAEDGEAFVVNHPELNLHIARLLAFRLQRVTFQLVELQENVALGNPPEGRVRGVLRSLADQF